MLKNIIRVGHYYNHYNYCYTLTENAANRMRCTEHLYTGWPKNSRPLPNYVSHIKT